MSLLCRDRGGPAILFQLLVHPAVDHNDQNESYERFGDGTSIALSRADAIWFHGLYTNLPEELDSPYVSPLRANSLAALPRTVLVAAEIDTLLQEGLEYAQRLEAAGVPFEPKVYSGMCHGFFRQQAF